jgi:hypothetical protein
VTLFYLAHPPKLGRGEFYQVVGGPEDGDWLIAFEQLNLLRWDQLAAIHASIREVLG